MSIKIPNNFTVSTDFGLFKIKITNRDYITIGAKENCVQIAYNSTTNNASLDWLGTEKGGCEINDKKIHGKNTVKMVDLGFTILRQLYPNVNPIVSLIDSSKFKCYLPNDIPVSVSNMIYNLLIYGKTYYQKTFNATLKYKASEEAYNSFVKARLDTSMFDKTYNFNNTDLNLLLQPILQSSNNWGEFFDKLYSKFGRNSCVVMYSWYQNVYGYLAQQAVHSEWVIDLNSRPMIDYKITQKNNSNNYTRKRFVYDPNTFSGGYYPSLISYTDILIKHKNNFTMKNKNL